MQKKESKVPRKRSPSYSRNKGSRYELKIIKELTELGYKGLKSSRSESRNLDADKIDIAETEDKLPCYVQCKCTKVTPDVITNINNCPRKDRPMAIFWNKQVDKANSIGSAGEYVIITKDYFYNLIEKQ